MNIQLKNKKMRYVFGVSIALIVSWIMNHYSVTSHFFFIALITLFTMQTSIGNSFYQGMQKCILVFALSAIAALGVYSIQFFYAMAHDVLIGAGIGILVNVIIFPRKPDSEFREKIFPVIKLFNDYFSLIIDQLLQHKPNQWDQAVLENALLELPDWVYERGFDSVLQKGYQFFLMTIEHISDVLLSMHHLVQYSYDKELVAKIRPSLLQYVEQVNSFFLSIMKVLELKTLADEPSDLEQEFSQLQKQFFRIVPESLELLDIRRDYVYLAAFIYHLNDLRKLLLKMGEALR